MDWKEIRKVFWKFVCGTFVIGLSFVGGIMTMVGLGSSGVVQDRIKYIVFGFVFIAFLLQFRKEIFGFVNKVRRSEVEESE